MAAPQPKPFEIAIIGGGIAGATLAIAFLKRSIPFTLYEQGHAFSEIGAGVALSPNAVHAMKLCDPAVHAAFQKVATKNGWESKRNTYFDILDGTSMVEKDLKELFTLANSQGQNAVHRAYFMDELSKQIPEQMCRFRKRLQSVDKDQETGKLTMRFTDGSSAQADAVIGCDGIKSRTRALVVGEDHPGMRAQYTHKYAYRGVIPMEKAVEALGEERAVNGCLWLGPDAHMLSYPINGGKTFNMFGAVTDPGDWPSMDTLTAPATKEQALKDYEKFGPAIKKQIQLCEDNLERWALFDCAEHPLPYYNKGRIVVVGDAAHAVTPHHGAGAGFCIEDSAVLACLLEDERVRSVKDLEAVFEAYNANRIERTQWLVATSRKTGDLYEFKDEAGRDMAKVEEIMRERYEKVWNFDIEQAVREARKDLGRRLK
ncbi:salicylate 1-monooxygenase sala [Pseudomassariella vexata]|uniref:Salicylate 1-monooxygenase sala n=1 Tax=Pseudomassariella vexata TaxID=1141098 RepID=A0A1Y2DIY0_9PEZI|nr:salicylate 1-monooxygenase sala [Pseudomassariella vexata]ORY59170.1 salicylate 1-monooxygenase sala [Pseudomassariella vexata]